MKNNQSNEYSNARFFLGVFSNLFKNFILIFSSVVLITAGIWIRECLSVGLVLLALDILVSVLEELRARDAVLNKREDQWEAEIIASRWKTLIDEAIEGKGKSPDGEDTDRFSA